MQMCGNHFTLMSSVVYFQFSILCCAAWCKKSLANSRENVFFFFSKYCLFEERVGYRSSVKGANCSITNTANFNVRIILREVPLPGWMPASYDGFALRLVDLVICGICHGVMGLRRGDHNATYVWIIEFWRHFILYFHLLAVKDLPSAERFYERYAEWFYI